MSATTRSLDSSTMMWTRRRWQWAGGLCARWKPATRKWAASHLAGAATSTTTATRRRCVHSRLLSVARVALLIVGGGAYAGGDGASMCVRAVRVRHHRRRQPAVLGCKLLGRRQARVVPAGVMWHASHLRYHKGMLPHGCVGVWVDVCAAVAVWSRAYTCGPNCVRWWTAKHSAMLGCVRTLVFVAVCLCLCLWLWLLKGAATCVTVSGCAVRQQRSRATGGAARRVRASVVRPGPLLCSAGRRQSRMLGIAAQGEGGCGWGCVACGCVWLCGLWLCGLWPVSFGSGCGCGCVAVWQWQWLWLFLWLQRAILLLEQLLRLPLVLTHSLPCVCCVVQDALDAPEGQFVQVSVSASRYSCAIRVGGDVVCWGNPSYGITGTPEYDGIPFLQVTTARTFACGLKVRTQRHTVMQPRDHTRPHTVTHSHHTLWPH